MNDSKRIELATTVMAGLCANPKLFDGYVSGVPIKEQNEWFAKVALDLVGALIDVQARS